MLVSARLSRAAAVARRPARSTTSILRLRSTMPVFEDEQASDDSLPPPPGLSLSATTTAKELEVLKDIETRVNWLAALMIHNANNVRPQRDPVKVGGHQASSASLATIMTALYMRVLQPQDRVAVKPHAGPVFHALQYLMGRQTEDNLKRFRSFGGIQPYPSRTKDLPEVDISTGSVGLGAALTSFTALTETYLRRSGLPPKPFRAPLSALQPAGADWNL
jgi:pyruvate dehydrogenase E1 component